MPMCTVTWFLTPLKSSTILVHYFVFVVTINVSNQKYLNNLYTSETIKKCLEHKKNSIFS